jgi:hypothetical protein
VRRQRDALRRLVASIQHGVADDLTFEKLAGEATSTREAAHELSNLLRRFLHQPERLKFAEVGNEDYACPHCNMTIATVDLARMNDATFVHEHTCGTLLTRCVDS